jgi:steroid delta-isomerase-like uncharacterized protein
MSSASKDIVRQLYEEVWSKRRFEVLNEVISPSHALNDPHLTGSAVGPDAYKRVVIQFIAAFPDLKFIVEDYICENDRVVASWVISGTHRREFRGIPATNKKFTLEGVTINHVTNGKIMESYVCIDYLGMLQQLGVAPAFGQLTSVAAR